MRADAATGKKRTVAVPAMVVQNRMVGTVVAVESDFEALELNPIRLLSVACGLLDIADDVLPRRIRQRTALNHRLEKFFHAHDVRANPVCAKPRARAVPTFWPQANAVGIVVALEFHSEREKGDAVGLLSV